MTNKKYGKNILERQEDDFGYDDNDYVDCSVYVNEDDGVDVTNIDDNDDNTVDDS